jgi:hypothetical protein
MSDSPEVSIQNVSPDSIQVNVNAEIKEMKNNFDKSCLSHQHQQFINNRKKLFSSSNPKLNNHETIHSFQF